ncbi:MAG: hypothetical protein R6U40_13460, partial [Desulfobacterales bacterium]
IHAGLECGVIGAKYPGMEMVSLGPTVQNAHSPDERLHLPSLEKTSGSTGPERRGRDLKPDPSLQGFRRRMEIR